MSRRPSSRGGVSMSSPIARWRNHTRDADSAPRRMRWHAALLVLALLVPSISLAAAPARVARAAPAFVTIAGDHFVLNGQPVVIKGANYYQRDAPWAAMWDQWNGPQVEQE